MLKVQNVVFSVVNLEKIVIYGASGSGKSTLAKQVGKFLSIESIHLDDLFWFPDWKVPTTEMFKKIVSKKIEGESWIIDGNYSKVRKMILSRATFAIILDLPLYIPIWRIIARTLSRNSKIKFHHSTPLPKRIEAGGSKENSLFAIYELSTYAIKHKFRKNKIIRQEVQETLGQGNFVVLKSKKQVEDFLNEIKRMKVK